MKFPIHAFLSARVPTRFRTSEKHAPDSAPSIDSEKPSLTIASPVSTPSPPGAESPDRTDEIIGAKLAQFSQVPVSTIFQVEPGWSYGGLSEEAAAAALAKHGPNIPVTERPLAVLALLWTAIMNPFNILLTTLACVSIGTKDVATFSVMMAMVVCSTGLRYWQEVKSMAQAINLIKSVSTRVRVVRTRSLVSEEIEIDQKEVVPGDVLAVASGDVFPGDCVVISSSALSVTQASLTGELMPIEKTVRLVAAPQQQVFNLLDNENVCLAGTSVSTGNGRAIVISTGSGTYMASIAKQLEKKRPPNATQIGIRKVSYVLLGFLAVMAPLVFVIQGGVSHDWKGSIMFAIAVAVGITPEMLPMIVTSNLALSAVRVSRQKVIVKRFDAIQNLGAVSILCSDKTGTLTADLVRISTSTSGTGSPSYLPIKLAYINSLLQTGTRSPIDRAIVDFVNEECEKSSFGEVVKPDGWIKQGEVPFDSARRLLSVLVSPSGAEDSEGILITKGAVEEVLDRCVDVYVYPSSTSPAPSPAPLSLTDFKHDSSALSPLTADERQRIIDTAERLNGDGLRLVAVACRTALIKPFMTVSPKDEDELIFMGFLGFLDPLKPDAADAVKNLAKLSVQVRILTGDAPTVAAKVARDLGILPAPGSSLLVSSTADPMQIDVESAAASSPQVANEKDLIITGSQLAALKGDKVAYTEAIERCIVFAKLSPYQKLEVVESLRAGGGGRAVAFLGDGVNDALAIRGADVGISVDSGMEIAKEAADVILLEKSLGVVANGVLQGRMTFVNTMKYIKMATSSNFGNVFSVVVASAWLPYQPMLPLQLLTQNLLYDFSQASIPWDNIDPECLEKPRTWSAKSIFTFMICLGPFSSPFDIITFSINWFKYGIRTADSPLVRRAQTNWFLEGSLTQLFIIHFLRTGQIPFIQSRASLPVVAVTFLVAGIAMAIPYIPKVSSALKMMPPEPVYYGYLVAMITGYACVIHVVKSLYLAKFKEWI